VYFKETQTPADLWVETPIIVDKLQGQQHFFPCIADAQKLKQNFESHGCKKAISSGSVSIELDKKMVL